MLEPGYKFPGREKRDRSKSGRQRGRLITPNTQQETAGVTVIRMQSRHSDGGASSNSSWGGREDAARPPRAGTRIGLARRGELTLGSWRRTGLRGEERTSQEEPGDGMAGPGPPGPMTGEPHPTEMELAPALGAGLAVQERGLRTPGKERSGPPIQQRTFAMAAGEGTRPTMHMSTSQRVAF